MVPRAVRRGNFFNRFRFVPFRSVSYRLRGPGMRGSRLHGNNGGCQECAGVVKLLISAHPSRRCGRWGPGMRGFRLRGERRGQGAGMRPNPHPNLLPEGEGICPPSRESFMLAFCLAPLPATAVCLARHSNRTAGDLEEEPNHAGKRSRTMPGRGGEPCRSCQPRMKSWPTSPR